MVSSLRKSLFLLLLIAMCILLIEFVYNNVSLPEKLRAKEDTKYILYWTKMFQRDDFNLGMGSQIFADCPISNCVTTNNRTLLPVEEFDAILFHGIEYNMNSDDMPSKRSPNQIYIFSNQESPVHTPDISNFIDYYNWTMTYRLDSDVIRPYGFFEKRRTNYKPPTVDEIVKRPKKIAWLVSNCNTASERDFLFRKLRKYIEVDVFGMCGKLSCSRENPEECYDFLERNYKFYLSFENSICPDYVTEKLYNILKKNLIPLTYGGADYNRVAPPKSVIDVTKFESIKQLVEFIRRLDARPEEYLEYFEWKRNYVVDTSNRLTLCSLCAKLNQPIEHKTYSDIAEWWNGGSTAGKCKYGPGLPKIIFK